MSELLNYLVQNDQNFRRARLPALYSDFRSQKTLNPDGYAANVAAWKRGLANAALAGHLPPAAKSTGRNHLILEPDGDALMRSLESKQFGRPLALGTALQDALSAGELLPLSQFLSATQSIYSKSSASFVSWAAGMPLAMLGWGLRQVGLVAIGGGGGDDSLPKGQFVVLQNLETAGKAFADAAAERTSPFERTFSKAHFHRTFGGSLLDGRRLSETDLEVLVKFLSRDKGLLVTDGNTIKIRSADDPAASTITEEDAAIASLKALTEDLAQQTAALSARVDALAIEAQDAVVRKNRVAALAALRSKKRAESLLATRHATLSQLEDVAAKMQQAADNVALVRVMQSSTTALRALNARVGGADKVEEVLDGLREQMGEVDEVGNIISEAGAGVVVDEGEVDDEFEAMLKDEKEKEELAERVKREEREAEETRRKLAELEKLAPVPAGPVGEAEKESGRVPTPVTGTAKELGEMHI
ncbi:Snf7-domain-containing protein [Biscogniauxia mediterranea]|nr:Snf7-domain-containing protein [Biscogniauxia mediterranea]